VFNAPVWVYSRKRETTQARREQCVMPRSAQRLRAYAAYRTHVNLHSTVKQGKSANFILLQDVLGLVSDFVADISRDRTERASGPCTVADSVDRGHTVWRMAMFIDY
jgi:hypothetical protein